MTTPLITERHQLAGVSAIILNIILTDANTEYSFSIPNYTRSFSIKTRNVSHSVKISFTEGQSDSVYVTLGDVTWSEINVLAGLTIYTQSPNAGCVLEVILWS